MAQIAEDYVSPSVRWGLLKQDYPHAVVDFSHATGAEIGIPETFGGKDEYCVAQILLRPDDSLPIIGYKPVSDARTNKGDHPSDAWNVLCTKALGRALKRAGYADTASEMKLVVQYKQRLAEHDAISGGSQGSPDTPTESASTNLADGDYLDRVSNDSGDSARNNTPTEITATVEEVQEDDDWDTVEHLNESHAELKARVQALPEEYQEKAREVHQGINGRQWPVTSVAQFNFLSSAIEALHEQADVEPDF
jgi:hypothetical protein